MTDLIQKKISLRPYTSWKVGGEAEYYSLPESLEDLIASLKWANEKKLEVTVLGGGTNVLVSDQGVKGLVVHTMALRGTEVNITKDRVEIVAWVGTLKAELLKVFLQQKLTPALFLSGLPGDVGGGVVMNAGVSEKRVPREFGEIVDWIDVVKKQDHEFVVKRYEHDEIEWSYRHSQGWQPGVVVRVGIGWPNEPDESVMKQTRLATRSRLQNQPLTRPSGGSTFVNPLPQTAGALIDQCGLKGLRQGGAQVSEKHANFIVTDPSAKAQDVNAVIRHVQEVVKQKTGVALKTEVVYLGDWSRDF